jgi:SAM-dependent methyltransferase
MQPASHHHRPHRIVLQAEREVAYESPDHLFPWGTRRDNSVNRRFNRKLYALYDSFREPLRVLDLGCSGGGFVRTCIDDGFLAVGLEGSDYSKLHARAEWATIPGFLFTCDITGRFQLSLQQEHGPEPQVFDVVTTWDVIEHISESNLARVAENVRNHLRPSGLWILSVSPNEEILDGVRLHQTVQQEPWWIATFRELGFVHTGAFVDYFNTQFIRGPKYGAPGSFHLVLSPDPTAAPRVPALSAKTRLMDAWFGSTLQRTLKHIVVGE